MKQHYTAERTVENMETMTREEMICLTIDRYTDLQRIKKANGDMVNQELEYQIRNATAKLTSMGVAVEDLKL